ncbi:hypothetical protein FDG04_19685 [Clostridium sporogenes]|uniref:hypothetical protein n=1 Tax=Clostridium sporogenes TaxID=1509 RepID=UPI0013CFC85B|nr:hypothetical protein [Clostridium sporogenes]NFQ87465.1 hypothetical protein [Clostridium sporogenes]
MNNVIEDCLERAKGINEIKINAVQKLENNLNKCPNEYFSATKKFIENIKTNINLRKNFINELQNNNFENEVDILDMILKLAAVDEVDNQAADMYEAFMNEIS